MTKPPIFIIGVPRSGTTLLRTMLDSHPNIAAGPETPWLCAHQPRSIGALVEYLCSDKHGFVPSYGGSRAEVIAAARAFVDSLLTGYATRRGKRRWAEKTPENLLHLPFLIELFPDARFIHLSREGLDVGLSTSITAPHRKGISAHLERRLKLAPGLEVDNSVFNAVLRQGHWERKISAGLSGRAVLRIAYEDLVHSPERTMRGVLGFVGEPFDEAVLNYTRVAHDQPAWEWGSADVAHLAKTAGGITADRAGRAERELASLDQEILAPLAGHPAGLYPTPAGALANSTERNSERFQRFTGWLAGLATPLGLRMPTGESDAWELPWIWFGALASQRWPGSRLVDFGSGNSPLPWLAALLGAHVTLVNSDAQWLPHWHKLRNGLGVQVDWQTAEPGKATLADAVADVVTGSARSWRPMAVEEAAKVLKRGGLFAASATIGSPADLRGLEDSVWLHPSFGQRERPAWTGSPLAAGPSVAAAVLRKV